MSDPGRKMFMGARLRRLREERGLTQAALAAALALSPSYLNQLENNQRPLTVAVLLKLNAAFGLDVQLFSDEDEARLLAQLREAQIDAAEDETLALSELRALAMNMPAAARLITGLNRRYRLALEAAHAASARLGDDRVGSTGPPAPYEAVRDFFYARRNHIAALDDAAEALASAEGLRAGEATPSLAQRLQTRHGVTLALTDEGPGRRFDAQTRRLILPARLNDGQRAFQIATQLAFLEQGATIETELAGANLTGEALAIGRLGLANYFAGAVLLPYAAILAAAERERYDVERLARRFGVGFETVCHRLSTLQRPGAAGVPLILVRADRAGNISKRQSATDFHFSRLGGSCPLWNLYEAFARPGRVSRQLAEMPDGRRYLWVARTVGGEASGFRETAPQFVVALGCDLRHASRLIYADGLELGASAAFAPIGPGCKVCDRPSCRQRAFPPLGRPLVVDDAVSGGMPYSFG
jgi:predicted transcriptional regulator/transcriptional regulator with XRE-family HTH domain